LKGEELMRYTLAMGMLALAFTGAVAQTPPANKDAGTPAVSTSNTVNPGAPAAGANSFTEAQARSRIEAAGFTGVSDLAKDKDGVWRGKATKAGKASMVSLDFQGNVVAAN
jgi:hypothetical protein